jgi:hypothetical protein
METIIRAGFESGSFTVEKDMTIDELIDVIVEHVDSLAEAMKAADMLGSIWNAGSYEGTGWRVWFVKQDPVPVLH